MKLLQDRIVSDGKVLAGDVLKVGGFLNHRVDIKLATEMARETAAMYENDGVTLILTVESSGIALAAVTATVMQTDIVFAKKSRTSNVSDSVYSSDAHSYTHGNDYSMIVERSLISANDRVLVIDDFLANGEAFKALIDIIRQSGAHLCGCVAAIEKGFQHGGDALREKGIRVDSLAVIESMENGRIVFRD